MQLNYKFKTIESNFKSQSLATQAEKREQIVPMMPAI